VQQELLRRQSGATIHPSKRSRRSHAQRLALLQHWILPAALHPRGFLGRCRHGPWPGGCLLRCWRASRSGWPGSGPQSVRRGRGGAPRVVVPSIISRRPHRSRHRRGPATRHPIAPLRSGAGTSPYRVPVAEFARQIARPRPRACRPKRLENAYSSSSFDREPRPTFDTEFSLESDDSPRGNPLNTGLFTRPSADFVLSSWKAHLFRS
jgi:hypothetical protein